MSESLFPYHLTPGGPDLSRELVERVPEEVRRDADASLLLMGCRQGENALALAGCFDGRIVGIEEDSESVFYAKMAAAEMKLAPRVSLQFMAPVATNFRPGQFTVVLLEGVLSSYPPGKVIKEVLRVLAPGGWLLASDSCWLEEDVPTFARDVWESPDHKVLTPPAVRALLEERGVEVLALEDRSDVLDPFYRQFHDTVRGIAKSRFEGMKHQKALVKHYKHEIDVYRKHGGARYMGYFGMVGRMG
ncbi:MAG: methyltransferase domain-containing protein [Bacteroidota bacterium]|jgi:SAM-dependent methyltransferase|nr:methyltransferase domain-containing protein [Bacteroidota bacterium]